MSESIRQLIKDILDNIKEDIQGPEASDKMVQLSRMLGNLGEHIVKFEKIFIQKKIDIMTENEKMSLNKIELLAQNTEEYSTLQEAKQLREATIETIRALKYRCRSLEDEYKTTM